MRNLDRQAWAASDCFESFGTRFGIRANCADVWPEIISLLPPGTTAARSLLVDRVYSLRVGGASRCGVSRFHLLFAGTTLLARSPDIVIALQALQDDLHAFVAEGSPLMTFVHAGAVGWHARAIVMPGHSFSGKSMLVAAFLRAGAIYYSDEYAVFDRAGRVHPFARPLRLRDSLDQSTGRANQFGAASGSKPLLTDTLVIASYRSGACWHPVELSAAQGVLELLAHAPAARHRPEQTLRTLARAVRRARIFKGTRGESAEVIEYLQKHSGRAGTLDREDHYGYHCEPAFATKA